MAPKPRLASASLLAAAISLALIQQTAAQNAPAHGLDANGLTMDPQQADRLQRRSVGTVPFQYTGSNARISVGIDDELQATGEGLGIFGFNGTRATLLEGWLGRHGAGGVKLGHHWLWGGATREDTLGDARDVWVAKVFGAVDRNEFHDRKATIGAGLERNNRFLDLYYEQALSDERRTSSTSDSATETVQGQDPDGRPWQQDITTTTLVEQFAVPYQHGVGFRFGRYFEYPMVRLRAGLDYAWGDELLADDRARQIGATVSAEKFFEDTGHSLALELGYHRKNGPFDSERFGNADDDLRVGLQWRYEFGQAHRRTDDIDSGADSDRPAPWVERALRNLPAHRRQVDTYAAQRTTVTTTEGERVYVNRAPVAGAAESFIVVSGAALTGNLLTNDSDPDPGDTLTAVLTQNVGHGTLVLNANGSFTYTPVAGYTGPDGFTYVVRDAQGAQSAPVTVNITVQKSTGNVAPVANADTAQAVVGGPIDIFVLGNDTDGNTGDTLAIASHTQPASGTLVLSGDHFTYTPTEVGTFTFNYVATDGQANSQPATVTITVSPAGTNLAPVAGPAETFAAIAGVQIAGDVLDSQDTDPNPGDTLHVELVSDVAHGVLQLNQTDGTFTYTADAAFTGPTDSFTYVVVDQAGAKSQEVTVTINVIAAPVNQRPIATADDIPAVAGTTLVYDLFNNDSDENTATLTLGSFSRTESCTPSGPDIAADGTLTWTVPGTVAFTCTLTYTVKDEQGLESLPALVTITVASAGTNLSPVAGLAETFAATAGVPITGDVLDAQDTDPNPGDILHVELVTDVTHGTLQLNQADGTFTYTADAAFTGPTDSFTYVVEDQDGARSQEVMVTINVTAAAVNGQPVAVNDSFIDILLGTTGVIGNVLTNDDDESPATLTVVDTSVTYSAGCAPVLGSGGLSSSGDISITGTGTAGTCLITYVAQDEQGLLSAPATATVQVGVAPGNRDPIAEDDTYTTPFETTLNNFNVLDNDPPEPDGDARTVQVMDFPQHGELFIGGGGTMSYVPDALYSGPDSFTYVSKDGRGGVSNLATVRITVEPPVNQAPIAVDDGPYTTANDTPIGGSVQFLMLDNDMDPEDGPGQVTLESFTLPARGQLTITGDQFLYIPEAGDQGDYTFTYTVKDWQGLVSNPATVFITVEALP